MATTIWPFTKEGYAHVPGGRAWYGMVGDPDSSAIPLLVIHGGPGMTHDYLYPLTDLADERPVVFYDQLDAGKSDRPNDPCNWRIERFIEEIDVIRNTLGLIRVHVFGNSWGGALASAYAAQNPAGLEKLILSSPLVNTSQWIEDNTVYRNALPDNLLAIMDRYEASGETDSEEYEAAVGDFYARHLCRTDPWPDYVNDTLDGMSLDCYAAMWGPNEFTCNGTLQGYDGSSALASITVPTLVTCGEFDEATPGSTKKYANMIPGAEFEVFADSSHMAFVENRNAYVGRLRHFMAP